jgi:hypothetical protein
MQVENQHSNIQAKPTELAKKLLKKFNAPRTKPIQVTQDLLEVWEETLTILLESYTEKRVLEAATRAQMRTSHFPQPSNVLEMLEDMEAPSIQDVTLVEYRRQIAGISSFWWTAYRHADAAIQGQVDRIMRECHADQVPADDCCKKFRELLLEAHPLAKTGSLENSNQSDEQRNIQRNTLIPSLPMPEHHVVAQAQESRERADRDTQTFTSLAELLRGHPDRPVLDSSTAD